MSARERIGDSASDGDALKRLISITIVLIMVLSALATVTFLAGADGAEAPLTDLVGHSPVEIDGETELASTDLVVSGTGSWNDPYIIEGWTINATGETNAIEIANTYSYIWIRDCYLSYAELGTYDKCGLLLDNVTNTIVQNVTAYENVNDGIKLVDCTNITVVGCTLIDNGNAGSTGANGNGMTIHSCADVVIDDCTVIDNQRHGLYFTSEFSTSCINITVRNCDISGSMSNIWTYSNRIYGFTLENCLITDFSSAGFWMRNEVGHARQTDWVIRNVTIENDIAVSTNGAMVLFELTGALIEDLEISQVLAPEGVLHLCKCDNVTITDSSFDDNAYAVIQLGNPGFLGYSCQNITLTDITIRNSTQHGIWVYESRDTTISDVIIDTIGGSSGRGIRTERAVRTDVLGCVITNCNGHGIYVTTYTSYLLVRDCDISENGASTSQYGIYITSNIENVTVVNNTLTNNNGADSTYDANHIQARDDGLNNHWNDSSGGNRWADWLGPDSDYDGFVDLPYNITGVAGAKDMLPLADPETIDPVVIITSPAEGAQIDSLNVTIEWQAWDNQSGLQRFEVVVDSDAPIDVGLNTSYEATISEGAHTVTVTAYDNDSNSGSDIVNFSVQLDTVPGQPAGLNAAASDSAISLSWTAPDDGGDAITVYHIYRGPDVMSLVEIDTTDQLDYDDTGLTNGQEYFYSVSAENSVGEGPQSDAVSAIPVNVPGAPTNLLANAIGTTVTLSWDEPEDNGSDIDHYNVYRGTGGTLVKIGESTVTTYSDVGLDGDTTYYYQVSAVNGIGEGVRSAMADATVIVAPGAPLDLDLALLVDGVNLEWSPPASDGGSAIINYSVYRGSNSTSLVLIANVTTTSYNDTGLTAGTLYYYAISATNSAGESDLSEISNITFATMPGTPSSFAVEIVAEDISVSWVAPSDGGSPITSYVIEYGTTTGVEQSLSTVHTSYSFSGFETGQTYYFRVHAVNAIGSGGATSIISITYVLPPSAPSDVNGTEDDGGIQLTWAAPDDDGGTNITCYCIYRCIGTGEMVLLTTVNGTSYLDADVQENITYTYVIKAVNAEGESISSDEVIVTFQPYVQEEDGTTDGGFPWYILVIPLIAIVLIILFIWIKRSKKNGEKKD